MDDRTSQIGEQMWRWASDLFPICRSITGPGVRETLGYIKQLIPALNVHAIPSGSKVFDWIVPDEWSIRDAYVADADGNRVIDFRTSNLHVMGYSVPVDASMSRAELDAHLYSLPAQPELTPYVTSYYTRRWGFCLPHRQRQSLPEGQYRAVIESEIKPGVLNYADVVIPGESDEEVLLSTYICHPSLANNELSGPVVTAALAQWLGNLQPRHYTYRIIFIPETIGAIAYLSRHLDHLRAKTVAGFVVTCVGDDRMYSYLPSRRGDTLADRAAHYALERQAGAGGYRSYSFLDRGSDERQFCSPGVDLPVCSIMRSRYGTYPEYHTSADDLSLVTPSGLAGALAALKRAIVAIESNVKLTAVFPCEPHYSKYGLRDALVGNTSLPVDQLTLSHLMAYADGRTDLIAMAQMLKTDIETLYQLAQLLAAKGLATIAR